MENFDPTKVDDPWSALVVVVLILALLVWPGINSHLARRHARDAAAEIRHQANPNSGKSLKDALNRIEAEQVAARERDEKLETRLELLERQKRSRWRF